MPLPRLLAIDLDGTLLRRDHSVDPRDIGAIAELRRAGVTVSIVTGRLLSGSVDAARTCSIEGPIACVEGSHLVDLRTNETLLHRPMGAEEISLVRGAIEQLGLTCFLFEAEGIHYSHDGHPFAPYVATWSPRLRLIEDEGIWAAPLAVVAIGDTARVDSARFMVETRPTLHGLSFELPSYPGKKALLVRMAGTSKGTALLELCRLSGCTAEESVAVGDWLNDLPMFDIAGRSFAMGAVPEQVASRASDRLTTRAGAGGGIAELIKIVWG